MGGPPTSPPDESVAAGERRKAFDALAEASADGIVMVDEENVIRYANPAVERILGYAPDDLDGAPLVTIIPDRFQRSHLDAFREYLDTGEKHLDWTYLELPGCHDDGHEVPLAISFGEFGHDGDRYFVGSFRDISEQKEAEQALEERERELRTLIRLLPVGIFVAEKDGRIVEWNEAAEEIWGGEIAESESVAEYEKYDGWWADTGEPVEPDEWPLARALRGEEVTDPDVIEIGGFDGERRTVLIHGMPVRDADGEVTRAVVTLIDVTEREERKEQLRRQNERLDQFASMLAHELRNPLEIAQIYLDFVDDGDEATIDQIADALERIEEIIDVLLMLARSGEVSDREPVSLTGVAKEAWTNTTTGDAELEVRTSEVLFVNPVHLKHLLENLFRNAVEHGSTSNPPEADDAIEHSDGPVTVRVGALEDGFYVEDTGPGIPEAEREAVVEAGYTTDEGGIGLGLTLVAEVVDAYGGEYAITESDDGGARFEFTGIGTVHDGEEGDPRR